MASRLLEVQYFQVFFVVIILFYSLVAGILKVHCENKNYKTAFFQDVHGGHEPSFGRKRFLNKSTFSYTNLNCDVKNRDEQQDRTPATHLLLQSFWRQTTLGNAKPFRGYMFLPARLFDGLFVRYPTWHADAILLAYAIVER